MSCDLLAKEQPTHSYDLSAMASSSVDPLVHQQKHPRNIDNRRNTRVADKVDPEYGFLASQPHSPGA